MDALIYVAIVVGMGCAFWGLKPLIQTPIPQGVSGLGRLPGLTRARRRRWLLFLARVGRWIPASTVRVPEKVKVNLVYTGSHLTVEEFRAVKVLSALALCFAFSVLAFEFKWRHPLFFLLALSLGFILPDLWLRSRHQGRQQAILRFLPEVTDLLSVSVRAGLDFFGAVTKVVSAREFQREPLTEELSLVLQEVKLGKRKAEALKAMSKRVNLPEVSSFVRTIVQAERMGTPIAEALGIHSDDVRFERVQRAERAAMKAPIKILIPLIFFIMPCVAIIIGAPIFIQFMHQNPFAGLK